jgi:hypothetical protein
MVLNGIYEGDFVGFSYGFRPGRGPHDALDAPSTAIKTRKVNWILDADIRNFFGAVSQDWLVRFVEHRIGDERIIRLMRAISMGPPCSAAPSANSAAVITKGQLALGLRNGFPKMGNGIA